MILRRVIAHFRKQEWTAIAIDFVIVVAGVFVGLQVANWNQAEADRRVAEKYLSDIVADVKADIVDFSRVCSSANDRIAAAAYVLRKAGVADLAADIMLTQSRENDVFAGFETFRIPEVAEPPEALRSRLWMLAVGVYNYDPNRLAFDALVSSGKIDLIRDADLMRSLREYYYLLNSLDRSQTRTIVFARNSSIERGVDHGLSPSGVIDEARLIDLVKSNPTLAASLATSREYAALNLVFCDLLRGKAKDLVVNLEQGRP